jgi:hypothetical protein
MDPASPSPQPPLNRPEGAGRGWQQPGTCHHAGQDQDGHTQGRYEVYGPLSVERQLKQDGRALIVYARIESEHR